MFFFLELEEEGRGNIKGAPRLLAVKKIYTMATYVSENDNFWLRAVLKAMVLSEY